MEEVIVRRNAFTQESQILRATYPQIFEKFFKLFEREEIDQATLQKWFRALCRHLRAEFLEKYAQVEKPASEGSGGRLSKDEAQLRNEFRRNVYVLVRDLDGLKWWPHLEGLIKREAAGKRPSSVVAKPISYLMHFILRDDDDDLPVALNSAAIVDMANQLAYAKRHEVPFQFLIGFLSEVNFDVAAKKERAGEWEEWHPKYVKVETLKLPEKTNRKNQDTRPIAAEDQKSKKSKKEKNKGKKPSKV